MSAAFAAELANAGNVFNDFITISDNDPYTESNVFIRAVLDRFNVVARVRWEAVSSKEALAFNAFLHGTIGTLARRSCKESGVRFPVKVKEVNELLLSFVQQLRTKRIKIEAGGTLSTTYVEADTESFVIHFNTEWSRFAYYAVSKALKAGPGASMITRHGKEFLQEHKMHVTLGVVKLMHELAHLFTVPIMRYVRSKKNECLSSANLVTPVEIGNEIFEIGFGLEEIILDGHRLYFPESDGFAPSNLLFSAPNRVPYMLPPLQLDEWMNTINTDDLPESVTHPDLFVRHFHPPRLTKANAKASALKRKGRSAGGQKEKKKKAADTTVGSSFSASSSNQSDESDSSSEDDTDIPVDRYFPSKPHIKP